MRALAIRLIRLLAIVIAALLFIVISGLALAHFTYWGT